jgi:hypothetical protein
MEHALQTTWIPMRDASDYRVTSRKTFVIVMVIRLIPFSVGVWIGLDHLAEYGERENELAAEGPVEAGAILSRLSRTLAILNVIVLSSLAMLIIWHGSRWWRTAMMPPKGAWILEGQRTWSGDPAVRIAKFTVLAGVMLAVLGVAGSVVLWDLGDMFIHP